MRWPQYQKFATALLYPAMALLCASPACNVKGGFKGAGSELFDPDVTFIGRPERLAEGLFSRLRVEADLDTSRFLVALNEDSELTLIPLDDGKVVVVGETTKYTGVDLAGAPPTENMLAFIGDGAAGPELLFTNLRGQLSSTRVVDTNNLPRRTILRGPDGELGVEVATEDGRLLFVNPWSGQSSHILCAAASDELVEEDCGARFVRYVSLPSWNWSIELQQPSDFTSRALVVRNGSLLESSESRLGSGVVDFERLAQTSSAGPAQIDAIVEECQSAAAAACRQRLVEIGSTARDPDERTTTRDPPETATCATDEFCRLSFAELTLPADDDGDVSIALDTSTPSLEDACFAHYHSGPDGLYLSYFSPCADGPLLFRRRATADGSPVDEPPCLVDTQAISSPLITSLVTGSRLTYIRETDETGTTELTTQLLVNQNEETDPTQDVAPIACGMALQSLGLNPTYAAARGATIWANINFDGATGTGELTAWKEPFGGEVPPAELSETELNLDPVSWLIDGELVERLSRVATIDSSTVLAEFDGSVGDLLSANDATDPIETLRLARGVPFGGYRSALEGQALITDFNGATGDLVFFEQETSEVVPISSAVRPGDYFFAGQFSGLLYLAEPDLDTGTATLNVTLLKRRDLFPISSGVTEYHEVSIPSPGVLYAVTEPPNQAGIWFARAR